MKFRTSLRVSTFDGPPKSSTLAKLPDALSGECDRDIFLLPPEVDYQIDEELFDDEETTKPIIEDAPGDVAIVTFDDEDDEELFDDEETTKPIIEDAPGDVAIVTFDDEDEMPLSTFIPTKRQKVPIGLKIYLFTKI
ncbi:hypothetical protein QE152_g37371 [Popillia japonica]|uniref:Uncharacterized protein n=1 Tax=Popillia japonica TaxID=7064 RepID=A0AAW1IAT2_POPJA